MITYCSTGLLMMRENRRIYNQAQCRNFSFYKLGKHQMSQASQRASFKLNQLKIELASGIRPYRIRQRGCAVRQLAIGPGGRKTPTPWAFSAAAGSHSRLGLPILLALYHAPGPDAMIRCRLSPPWGHCGASLKWGSLSSGLHSGDGDSHPGVSYRRIRHRNHPKKPCLVRIYVRRKELRWDAIASLKPKEEWASSPRVQSAQSKNIGIVVETFISIIIQFHNCKIKIIA